MADILAKNGETERKRRFFGFTGGIGFGILLGS